MNEISFLRGVPALEALTEIAETVANTYKEVVNKYGTGVLQYQTPGTANFNGFIPLKNILAERYGLEGDPDKRVVCFNGGMEVLSLVLKSFETGSKIATEALTYDRTLADIKAYGHQVVGIPFTDDGIDLDILEKELSQNDVKIFYRVIYHQNPTGLDSTMENIEAAARICEKHGVHYICDIAYYELRYDGKDNQLPDLKGLPLTSLIGSFTKTLSPGTKCGFGIFPEELVKQITPVIANSRLNPNYPTQAMIHAVMESGRYDEYLTFLKGLYLPRMNALNEAMEQYFPGIKTPVLTGGFFTGFWMTGIKDEQAFIKKAKENGVNISEASVFAPGFREHYQKEYDGPFFRLTFPSVDLADITEGVKRLSKTYNEMK